MVHSHYARHTEAYVEKSNVSEIPSAPFKTLTAWQLSERTLSQGDSATKTYIGVQIFNALLNFLIQFENSKCFILGLEFLLPNRAGTKISYQP